MAYGSGVGNYIKYVSDSTTMKVYRIVANYPIDDAILAAALHCEHLHGPRRNERVKEECLSRAGQ